VGLLGGTDVSALPPRPSREQLPSTANQNM
jgi:hypothetical protein